MNLRAPVAFAWDVAMAMLAWALAFWLRHDLAFPDGRLDAMAALLPHVAIVHAVVFWAFGLPRILWRYAGVLELQRILAAVGVCALAVPAAIVLAGAGSAVPRSVYLIAPVLTALLLGGSRLAWRAWKERSSSGLAQGAGARPVLVLGAGEAAARLLRDLEDSREWRVVGLLDDNVAKHGGAIRGVKVLGPIASIAQAAARFDVAQAVIAMPGVSHALRKRAVEHCTAAGLKVMTVPAHDDIVSGRVSISALRGIELDDLLGRDPVRLDDAGLAGLIGGTCVLVTGAGGSIGAELCRQVARFSPSMLVLLDVSEAALYTVQQEFADRGADRAGAAALVAVVGDAKDEGRMAQVCAQYRPEVVFHAAAYKHVPLMEERNAFQAVQNNVVSTLVAARAARAAGAQKFVLVSTDKAVNPTSVMGASKRLAELLCQAEQQVPGMQFVIVRFGNVLGSSGSVVPRFREQIARGGPVTVTHPDIERYFMSIPEAAQLVLQAALMGKGGEIYVLDMGEPVKIVDLARQLIRLSGYAESDIAIEFTGLRPGEKLYEELLASGELTLPTPHPKLRVARAGDRPAADLRGDVTAWLASTANASDDEVRNRLHEWIPEYRPGGSGDPVQRRP